MSYLASRMFLCLLGALVIGLVVGWLLRRFSAIEREAELTGEIDLRDERVGALEGDLGEREQKIFSLGQDLTRVQQKLPGLEATLAERDDQVMSLTMDLDSWKQKVPGLESQLQESTARSSQLDTELETLRGEFASHKKRASEEAANLTAQSDAQKQELTSLQSQIVTANDASSESSRLLDGLQQEFDALQLQSEAQANDRREREQALSELRLSLKNQEAERSSLAEQLTALGPVAARVDSQDMSIVSLNTDLRARDTAIKSLRDELAANAELNRELHEKAQSVDAMRLEKETAEAELSSARAQLTQANSAETSQKETLDRAKEQAAAAEREWRNRLRIAESGKTQVQADLYRRQEQIQRLEGQLKEAQKEAQTRREETRKGSLPANASSAQGLFGSSAQSQSAVPESAPVAGAPKQIDDRDWRARLRVAESARRRAEVQAQRDSERLRSLEAQLRALNDRPTPGSATALSVSATAAPVAAATPPAPPAPKGAEANRDSQETRFLDAKPKDVDDLREIKGVGKVLQKTLNSLGIYQFRQIAAFTDEDIAWVDDRLKFKGRIERDNWVKQATKLHKKKRS